jgi:hypothetical protein
VNGSLSLGLSDVNFVPHQTNSAQTC